MLRLGIDRMFTASGFDAGLLTNVLELRARDIVAESQYSRRKFVGWDVAARKELPGLVGVGPGAWRKLLGSRRLRSTSSCPAKFPPMVMAP
jgi:hypothetical protein